MIKLDKELLISELGYMANEFAINNSKELIKKNFGGFFILNNVLGEIYGMKYPLDGIFADKKHLNELLKKMNSQKLREFVMNSAYNLDPLMKTLDNFSKIIDDPENTVYPFAFNNYSEKDFVDIILGYLSTYGNDTYNRVKKYFEEKRIEFDYNELDDEGIGGFYTYISHINSGYVMMATDKYNTLTMTSLCHELGHAYDAEMLVFPQQKKMPSFTDIFLEVPSTTFEIGFDDYCIKNKIDDIGAKLLYITRVVQVCGYHSLLVSALKEKNAVVLDSGNLYAQKVDVVKKDEALLDENGQLLLDADEYIIDRAYVDKNGDYYIEKYLEYNYRDYVIYSIGYLFAMHLNEIRNSVSQKEYLKILNDITCLRKDNNIENMVNYMGIDIDKFISCDLINKKIKERNLSLQKRFNVYY